MDTIACSGFCTRIGPGICFSDFGNGEDPPTWRGSIDQRINGYDNELAERVRNEDAATRLIRIPGIGVLTATALVAAVGNAQTFSCGRDLAAWLGIGAASGDDRWKTEAAAHQQA